MNFSHLRYFYHAALEKNLARAAAKNLVTQSAVSLAIRKLEESLDCELLVHKKNNFQLTDEGEAVFKKCQDIFNSVENLKNEIRISKKEFTGTLNFATSHSIALSLLPEFLKKFKQKYPLVTPHFRLSRTSNIKKMLENGEIDFGITVDDGNLQSFEKTLLKKGNFFAISNSKDRIEGKGFIITEPRPETKALHQKFMKTTKTPLPVLMEIESWEIIYQFALKGIGIGFVPDFVLKSERTTHILQNSFIPTARYELITVQNKSQKLSKTSSAFIEELISFLENKTIA